MDMLYSYSICGDAESKCCDWSSHMPESKVIKMTHRHTPNSRFDLVQYSEQHPRLIEGYFDGFCVDTQVGIRILPASLLHIATNDKILVRECSTCVSALVEKDLFEIPDGKALYWCELDDSDGAVLTGDCWEIGTMYKSGHLQPRIQMTLDIYKNTRICPYEHSLATRICADEKAHLCNYLERFVDHSCKGHKRYSQVVVSLYVMSCFYAHDPEISGFMERVEEMFRLYESTSVNAYCDMLNSGASSNESPSLWFLKISRDVLTEEELRECDAISAKFWGWKKTEFKKQRKKIVDSMDGKEDGGGDEDDDDDDNAADEKVGASPFTQTEFKTALLRALFTEEYLSILEDRGFDSARVFDVCKLATNKLPPIKKLEHAHLAGRNMVMFDYDTAEMKSSPVFKALDKEQSATRGRAAKLKTNRSATQIPYTKVFFLESPSLMQLPGYVLNAMHQPMTRFYDFHLRESEKPLVKEKKKRKKKKEGGAGD